MGKVSINETTLTNIGDAIREKTGKVDLIAPGDMPDEIRAIVSGGGGDNEPTAEDLTITGDCGYRLANGGWNWAVEMYGNRMTTKDITNAANMFANNHTLPTIPFELNFINQSGGNDMAYLFNNCQRLEKAPKINNANPKAMNSMFNGCWYLESIPDNYFDDLDYSYMKSLTSGYNGSMSGMFGYCRRLRKLPSLEFISQTNPAISYGYSVFGSGAFSECLCLDEILNIPISHLNTAWTSNAFSVTFSSCSRLKNLTFGESGPMKWKTQTIDLTGTVGYGALSFETRVEGNKSGITVDKKVTNDATYQALKDDPNWYTLDVAYSRYNHDSAVVTINSLPDTSAYLASAGGTNTIKFKGASGSKTDGGAINTLTDAEIAVAAAKGWTVTLS